MRPEPIKCLPTAEDREQFSLELHKRAITLCANMREAGLNTSALVPYDGDIIDTKFTHYVYGSFIIITSTTGTTRVSVSNRGFLCGTPLAWDLLEHRATSKTRDAWIKHQQDFTEKTEAIERSHELLATIGRLMVYPDTRSFWGPNFKPHVDALSNVTHGHATSIEVTSDLRDALDAYMTHVRDSKMPGIQLQELERRASARRGKVHDPLCITDDELRDHVLQALRTTEGALKRFAQWIEDGERLPNERKRYELGDSITWITRRVFWYDMSREVTDEARARVQVVLDDFVRAGLARVAINGDGTRHYRLEHDLLSDDAVEIGCMRVSVPWLLTLPERLAARYLREYCDLSRKRSSTVLAQLAEHGRILD